MQISEGPEAADWLRTNDHPAALASNRFMETAEALVFVEALYTAGAHRVFVPSDTIRDERDDSGGDYSDTLIIEIAAAGVSAELAALYRAEAEAEGFPVDGEALPLINDRFLLLWWD
jgi:hypothetical protein